MRELENVKRIVRFENLQLTNLHILDTEDTSFATLCPNATDQDGFKMDNPNKCAVV